MILESVQGSFLNWGKITDFVGVFIKFEEVSIKGEIKKMAIFHKDDETIYVNNYKIMQTLRNNYARVVDRELKISKTGSIKTKNGYNMLDFKIETIDTTNPTSTQKNTDDIPF